MINTLISKFAIIPPKKQVVKIKKTEANSDSRCSPIAVGLTQHQPVPGPASADL